MSASRVEDLKTLSSVTSSVLVFEFCFCPGRGGGGGGGGLIQVSLRAAEALLAEYGGDADDADED